ncbi:MULTISPECIES: DUF4270 domain-containing protein [unclassified Capnocytophaga]|jgi:hypothetical protein|uniref:DUF4270 domain-containing protein n=1 Tax=unclassified Capnocytophaga TaxID=2640652 RepID=UPI000202DBE8|nr:MULTISPECIES: DUF4270 domain-containing protein [unclassified Capnocytophaga]EGD33381.1 hypothetical protein HMPREF9071_2175 [Capnocytophaga sp. oral taxon 338 str. F0234]MEB3004096.1 DUF4270 domain-containing protein [Capnocytophaga sp. G2]
MKYFYNPFFSLCGILLLISACNTDGDINSIDGNILGETNFTPKKDSIPLEFNNIKVKAIQTNGLNNYLLGQITQNSLGTTNISLISQVLLSSTAPSFGEKSSSAESSSFNENETVEKVYLYLPFLSKEKTKKDPNNSNKNIKTYTLDSIYGNKNARFTLKVEELNYHLSDTDSNLESKIYYSNLSVPTSNTLAEVTVQGFSDQAIVRHQFDDPTTKEDESKKEKDKLAPGIRIELSPSIFQTYLLNNEGSNVLRSNDSFRNLLKGIVISSSNFSADLLGLINLKNAKIEVIYTYLFKKDGKDFTKRKSYELNLTGGISFNKYNVTNESLTLSQDILYLKGGQGYVAEVSIPENNTVFKMLKEKKPIINQADLYLYVDKANVNIAQLPSYVLAYNADKGIILSDYRNDLANKISSDYISIGKLKKDAKGNYFYLVRITDHLTNIIKNNAENIKIGLAVSTHLAVASRTTLSAMNNKKYQDTSNQVRNTVLGDAENTLYTAIYGNSSNVPEAKKLKLKVYYTLAK